MRRQANSGPLTMLGTVPRRDARGFLVQQNAYAGYRPRTLLHDVLRTDCLILLAPRYFDTREIPPEVGADWMMWLTDREVFWYGELHRCAGQNVAELVDRRFPPYRTVEHPVLWVVEGPTPRDEWHRIGQMIRSAGAMREPYFVTYSGLMDGDLMVYGKDGRPSCLPTP